MAAIRGPLCINDVVFAELSIGFEHIEDCEAFLADLRSQAAADAAPCAFPGRRVFHAYRRRGGSRRRAARFFIGAHAAVASLPLLTRDAARYRTYFPTVDLIAP